MTEEEAREEVLARFGAAAEDRLARFADLLAQENARQNLVSPASLNAVWSRHLLDSAQLVPLAPSGRWVDVGAGAGLPGIVVAALRDDETIMVEPRARRVAFLREVVASLGLRNAEVVQDKAEQVRLAPAAVVSARAVASIEALFAMTRMFTTLSTRFLFPRGQSGRAEIASLAERWQGMFHVEQSRTDPASVILVASGVHPKCSASR